MFTHVTRLAQTAVPGAAIGVIAGATVGGLSALAGHPVGWAVVGTLTLGLPLAVFGAGYGLLVALGPVRVGVFAPAALYWLVGFPVSRLVHETVTPAVLGGNPTPPADVLTFLAYQALVSLGFAFGFVWLFERITPAWLVTIKDRNPLAEQLYARYTHHAAAMWEARERRRARRSQRPAVVAGGRGGSRRSA
jgi:hypothetical protein